VLKQGIVESFARKAANAGKKKLQVFLILAMDESEKPA
jgi:hypothetical protein